MQVRHKHMPIQIHPCIYTFNGTRLRVKMVNTRQSVVDDIRIQFDVDISFVLLFWNVSHIHTYVHAFLLTIARGGHMGDVLSKLINALYHMGYTTNTIIKYYLQ